VVSTIVSYIDRARASRGADGSAASSGRVTRESMTELMDDVWAFVTPTMRGIPNTKILRDGIDRYVAHRCLGLMADEFVVSRKREARPPLSAATSFLADALARDIPVAFLSLDNGEETALDSWHWVVVVSIEYEPGPDTGFACVEVIDECRMFKADLRKWYATTAVGGGFVSLRPQD
jgi:hypothetical protein